MVASSERICAVYPGYEITAAAVCNRCTTRAMTRDVVAALADTTRSLRVTVCINARPPSHIAAERVPLEKVLVNSIRYAIEAADEAGGREKSVRIRLSKVEGEIELVVEDNGSAS
jgi:C4-dicarboxylate-specific signal transduction histidine kinase